MRDFRALMVKYGRVDFLLEMNGTNGHHPTNGTAHAATPERAR
jgi:hypothetical protein